jgi:hypothetical protein
MPALHWTDPLNSSFAGIPVYDCGVDPQPAQPVYPERNLHAQAAVGAMQDFPEPPIAVGVNEIPECVLESPVLRTVLVAPPVVIGAVAARADHGVQ